jgi:hypothetical protein
MTILKLFCYFDDEPKAIFQQYHFVCRTQMDIVLLTINIGAKMQKKQKVQEITI